MALKKFKLDEEKAELYLGILFMLVAYAYHNYEAMKLIGLLVIIISLYHIEKKL